MKVKVCGIRTRSNLEYLEKSQVDWVGFIFYDQSKRNFSDGDVTQGQMGQLTKKKVGVFVNESLDLINKRIKQFGLDMVQLHGDETPAFCLEVKSLDVEVMKAFSVKDELPTGLVDYSKSVDYVLFDTKGTDRGGNGIQFDWSILESYDLEIPFMVSGGIGVEDAAKLKEIKNKKMAGVDINSRFELEPGLKDEQLVERFVREIKS